jgi:hypothetical protein
MENAEPRKVQSNQAPAKSIEEAANRCGIAAATLLVISAVEGAARSRSSCRLPP